MKKLVTLVLSLSMAFVLAVSASAATVYVDVDFGSDGSFVDAKGNAVLSNYTQEYYEKETVVKDTTVTHAGKTYTVPAYVIDQYAQGDDGKQYLAYGLYGDMTALHNKADYQAWYADGITYEMFVQYTGKFNSSNYYAVALMGNTW